MTILIVVNIVALWLLVVVQGLVLLEAVRQISQIRRELDFDDRPIPISLGGLAGRSLPEPARAVWSRNGAQPDGVLVLLSTDCATCRLVASGLRELIARFEQQRIVVVLQARDPDEATEMLAEAGLARDEVVVDLDSAYGTAFGIALLPAAVLVRGGIVSEGAVVRNSRQLHQLLDALESPAREGVHPSESSAVSSLT
jgi:hypothetical protein